MLSRFIIFKLFNELQIIIMMMMISYEYNSIGENRYRHISFVDFCWVFYDPLEAFLDALLVVGWGLFYVKFVDKFWDFWGLEGFY